MPEDVVSVGTDDDVTDKVGSLPPTCWATVEATVEVVPSSMCD